jgi:lysophospholipase L1-like esterase
VRYNLLYPRWAYDAYRKQLAEMAAAEGWDYLDLWNVVPEERFTNSAVHLDPQGVGIVVEWIAPGLTCER